TGRMSVSHEKDDVNYDDIALSTEEVDEDLAAAVAPTALDDEEDDVDREQVAEQDFSRWLSEIATGTESDTMLRYATTRSNSIDVTHSKPSVLTQVLSALRTHLTTHMSKQPVMNRII